MNFASFMSTPPRTLRLQRSMTLGCIAVLAPAYLTLARTPLASAAVVSATQAAQVEGTPPKSTATATLQQCLTAPTQAARSATFAGEMNAIPGTARMEMRIDVLERMPGDPVYHTVTAPGLGVWRSSASGVKVYTYLKQVTNLSAPAFYRGAVHFRWVNAKGRLLKTADLRTRRCEQSAPAPSETETPTTGGESPARTG